MATPSGFTDRHRPPSLATPRGQDRKCASKEQLHEDDNRQERRAEAEPEAITLRRGQDRQYFSRGGCSGSSATYEKDGESSISCQPPRPPPKTPRVLKAGLEIEALRLTNVPEPVLETQPNSNSNAELAPQKQPEPAPVPVPVPGTAPAPAQDHSTRMSPVLRADQHEDSAVLTRQEPLMFKFEAVSLGNGKSISWMAKKRRYRITEQVMEELNSGKNTVVLHFSSLCACTSRGDQLTLWTKSENGQRTEKKVFRLESKESATRLHSKILTFSWFNNVQLLSNVHPVFDNDKFGVGDILLFKINDVASNMQRLFTGSEWDHTGIVVPLSWGASFWFGDYHEEKWALLEATSEGVIACPLSARIEQYKQESGARVSVRHLQNRSTNRAGTQPGAAFAPDDPSLERLNQFMTDAIGQPYSMRKILVLPGTRGPEKEDHSKGYFCSHLCATALTHLQVLDESKHLVTTAYWPKAFATGGTIDDHLAPKYLYTCELECFDT